MIFRFKFYLLFTFFLLISSVFSKENVFIKLKVNDQIITNIDIRKEAAYLEILNPNIAELEKKRILDLAKKSLVKEIIKKNEILKFFVLEDKDFIDDKLLEDLILKLNISYSDFEILLSQKKTYSVNQIKRKLKTDILWNDLIYYKFNNQIQIDNDKLIQKIDKLKTNSKKEYSLSEIIFEKKQDQSLDEVTNKIKESIKEIGFNNTANIFSIADSSKFGGKIGWVDENNLSKIIIDEVRKLKKNQYTNVIQVGNNYLILMVNEIKITKIEINKEKEFDKLVKFETNKQLNQFSKIFFNKVSVNYSVNEN
tara:strand:- start:302 stop:1231 length:930 start_codon:yes stop_codon:yes gene_type:complete